ncbi:MAG TPA: histidine--tRNA ligase [bacterium]|nr:histidine--tRNA ligase [bacterium]
MELRVPRGMQDVLPEDTGRWQRVEARMRDLAGRYGYREIRTPIVEHTEVFQRGVGAGTDIVDKEMYTFEDRGGRSLTLRAEGTAPVVRAVLEHNLAAQAPPVRVYYICPIFRYDRPQAGRYRQHTQFGAEVIGAPAPAADAEVLSLAVRLTEAVGLRGLDVRLSSVGDAKCRPHYEDVLRAYYAPRLDELCDDCRRRYDTAPMRLLDCKREHDREIAAGAPRILDYLCDECRAHFAGVRAHLEAMGISYTVDPMIVRGLNYYTRTAFEAMSGALGAQNVVFGGGRYDGLAEQMGGPPTPGVGFGMGIERLLIVLDAAGTRPSADHGVDLFIATAGTGSPQALAIADRLRGRGLSVTADVMGRGLRSQMRQADRAGAAWVLLLGEDEVKRGAAILREMASGEQAEVPLDRVADEVPARIRAAGPPRGAAPGGAAEVAR